MEAFAKAKAEHGSIDVLVNNAGITRDRMFLKMTREDWDQVIETNLNSMFNVTKQVVADMVEKGWGRIVNISSVNGEKGQAGQTNYSAAEGGHARFLDGTGAGTGHQGRNGEHREPGLHRVPTWVRRSGLMCWKRSSPPCRRVKRLGEPSEIASIIAWLASEEGGYATGADFWVNGGLHMG